LADALGRVIVAEGGTLITGKRVRRIIIDGKRAKGVELESGEVLETSEALAAAIDFPQMISLAVVELFPEEIVKKANS
jgi:phytoene dehydrogenase-like protein